MAEKGGKKVPVRGAVKSRRGAKPALPVRGAKAEVGRAAKTARKVSAKPSAKASPKAPGKGRGVAGKGRVETPGVPSQVLEIEKIGDLLAKIDTVMLPAVEAVSREMEAVLGGEAVESMRNIGVAIEKNAREASLFFGEAARREDQGERALLVQQGQQRLFEALGKQSQLTTEIGLRAMLGVLGEGRDPQRLMVFQLGAPAYFPQVLHSVSRAVKTKTGVPVQDNETLFMCLLFALVNIDMFVNEPFVQRRFAPDR